MSKTLINNDQVDFNEWHKPEEWIDIRQCTVANSVYFLVGHSADYSQYNQVKFYATLSTAGNYYDIFVDGLKVASTVSGTPTLINWQDLNMASGWEVTYPEALVTHVVRITPQNSGDTLTHVATNEGSDNKLSIAVLWAHFTTTNRIDLGYFACNNKKIECISCLTNSLLCSSLYISFGGCESLRYICPLDSSSSSLNSTFYNCKKLKHITIKNMQINATSTTTCNGAFYNCEELENINFINSAIPPDYNQFYNCKKLKNLPNFRKLSDAVASTYRVDGFARNVNNANANLDFSFLDKVTRIAIDADSTHTARGIKSLTVSDVAPFNHTAKPQIDVAYTGMDQRALVTLFKSVPYCVGYTTTGSPTITDGVVTFANWDNSIFLEKPLQFAGNEIEIIVKSTFDTQPIQIRDANHNIVFALSFNGGVFNVTVGNSGLLWGPGPSAGENYFRFYKPAEGGTATLQCGPSIDNWTKTKTFSDLTYVEGSTFRFAWYVPNNSGASYIDLNESSIKVNGKPWSAFDGIDRKCSVVGCPGVADLTQADRDIIEDKGWELDY